MRIRVCPCDHHFTLNRNTTSQLFPRYYCLIIMVATRSATSTTALKDSQPKEILQKKVQRKKSMQASAPHSDTQAAGPNTISVPSSPGQGEEEDSEPDVEPALCAGRPRGSQGWKPWQDRALATEVLAHSAWDPRHGETVSVWDDVSVVLKRVSNGEIVRSGKACRERFNKILQAHRVCTLPITRRN